MKRLWHWLKDKWKIIKRSIVLLTALSQPITVIIAQRFGPLFEESGSDPFIIPADYAFLIWSIIVTGTIIYGIYQLLPFTYNYKYLDKISFQSILIFLGFDLWIMAALNVWLPTTVLIFMAMGVALRIVFRELLSVSLKFF